jgi:signal transduction histidine kinase
MRVSTRLATGSGLVFLLLSAVLAYEVVQVDRLARLSGELAKSGLAAAELALEQISDLGDLEAALRKFAVTGDPDYAVRARQIAKAVNARQGAMAALDLSPEVRSECSSFEDLWRVVSGALPASAPDKPSLEDLLRRLKLAEDKALAVSAAARRSVGEEAARAEASAREARRVSYAAALAALLVGAAALVLTVRSIQVPLSRLARGTRAVAQGRFDQRVEAAGGDEFSALAADFNEMVRRLGELDQMKKDLLSHVSHELKTPLAAMEETNQLLVEGIPGPVTEDQRRLLDLNLQSVRRLSALIAKLLDLSRMEAGVMEYDMRARDMVPLLQGPAAELEALARDKGVRVALDLGAGPLLVRGDGDRLYQVVTNLLENAIKFSPPGQEILLSARRLDGAPEVWPEEVRGRLPWDGSAGGAVLISVADRGPGVPEDQREAIFERFHQVRRGRGRSGSGVGLGLTICREIALAHRGTLWVADREGGGSLFTFALPALPREEAPTQPGGLA